VAVSDVDGVVQVPLDPTDSPLVVLLFSSPDCPIANAIAPEIERLHRQTVEANGRFYLVYARADITPARAIEHARQFGITAPILLDRDQELVAHVRATVTPEVFVIRTDRGEMDVVYQGRVNNLYASLGNRRDVASEHYARDAIAAAATDEEVEPAFRKPIGCYLERH